jgi:hypothetical protein
MKKSDFKPGTKVVASVNDEEYSGHELIKFAFQDYGNPLLGTVADKPAARGKVFVEWSEDDNEYGLEDGEVDMNLLSLESDLPQFEKDFKAATKLIKKNMEAAAELINISNKMATKNHAQSLAHMHDAVRPLINAMDSSGWRSSSWGC